MQGDGRSQEIEKAINIKGDTVGKKEEEKAQKTRKDYTFIGSAEKTLFLSTPILATSAINHHVYPHRFIHHITQHCLSEHCNLPH